MPQPIDSPSQILSASTDAKMTYRDGLRHAMRNMMADHSHSVILGQGVADHKGTFGTTLGLVDEFGPNRVIETPLAEDAVTGICIGAALNGLYPVNTHIRADFALLSMNQIINLAAKYKYMFGGLFNVPMLIRLVVGRSWGQGAQHSQSLQSLFAHIPGLAVIMPSNPWTTMQAYDYAVSTYPGPVISFEHRLMYDLEFEKGEVPQKYSSHPFGTHIERMGKDVTVVATSIMVLEAKRAAKVLSEYGIECEIIDLNCVSDIDWEVVMTSVRKTGRVMVADTSWLPYGVASEICRIIAETQPSALKVPVVSLGMQPAPCPTAKALEDLYYPNLKDMVHHIAKLVTSREDHDVPLPDEQSMADYYKKFRGPF